MRMENIVALWLMEKPNARCQEKLRKLQSHQVDRTPEANKITVADFLDRWLDATAKPNVAPTTHRRYEQLSRLHLCPDLGRMKIAKLMPMYIEHFFVEQAKAPRRVAASGRSVRQAGETAAARRQARHTTLSLMDDRPSVCRP